MQNHDEYKCEHPEMIKHISGIKSQEPPVYHHDWSIEDDVMINNKRLLI
mgnify:CR=1 FL=1